MCGGIPFSTASVVKILLKSCGTRLRGRPVASVSRARASAVASSRLMAAGAKGLSSMPTRCWNSSGIGGFQTRSLS
jgi:hypothetical protein